MNLSGNLKTPFNQTTLLGTRWGHFIVLTCDPFQSGALALYGEWARAETELLCSCLPPGAVALDVGANIGTVAIALAKKVGTQGLVLAFEPQRYPFMCLCGNVALTHCLVQTRCFNLAVSDNNRPIRVPVIPLNRNFNVGGVRLTDPAYDDATKDLLREEVPSMMIDELALPRVDLIKIDVEAMESKVLAGAADTVDRCRPAIFAEALGESGRGLETTNFNAMRAFFDAHGYAVRLSESFLHDPHNLRFCPEVLYPGSDHDLVAFPDEKPKPDWWLALPVP